MLEDAALLENFPLPRPTQESAPFWEACGQGRLQAQRCDNCTRFWLPPSLLCQHCWSESWTWQPLSGRGRIHSFVVYRRAYHPAFADHLPYVVAVVALDEGPRMPTLLLTADVASVQVGESVEVSFVPARHGLRLPWFRRVGEIAAVSGTD